MPPHQRTHLLIANPDRTSPAQFILVADERDANNFFSTLSIQIIGESAEQIEQHIKNKVSPNDRGFRPISWNFSKLTPRLEKREPKITEHIRSMRPMLNVSKLVYDDVYRLSESAEAFRKEIMGSCVEESIMSEKVSLILQTALKKDYFSENSTINSAIVSLIKNNLTKMGLIPRNTPSTPKDTRPLS